jgi:glycosyltransferase involved in cell wall biosynthesis
VRRGYDVRVYNDLNVEDKSQPKLEPVYDDKELIGAVTYRHHTNLLEDLKYDHIDYFISSRTVAPFLSNVHSCKKFVMIHDIWLSNDPSYDIQAWQVQKYAYLSEWHKNFLMHHHKIPAEKMFLTGNGVVQDLYKDVDSYVKKNKIVYSSSPDRGLYQLLQMFPSIRKEIPDLELAIAYGFFNWRSSAKARNDLASMALMEKIESLMKQPGIVYLDRVDKKTLAHHQKEAKAWLMPTWFSETFCITSVENGLAKNALLSTNFAGLTTTIGDSGILLPYDPRLTRDESYPKEYTDRFIAEAVKLFKNEDYRLSWANKAYNKMKEYSWENIADGWIKQFKA